MPDESALTTTTNAAPVNTGVAEELPQKPVPMKELGTIGVNVIIQGWSGKEAVAFEEVSISKLAQMVRMDGSAAGLLNLIKLPIMATAFDIQQFDKKSITEAAWVEQNLTFPPQLGGMVTPLRYVIADMCMGTVTGFRAYEKVWDYKQSEHMYVLKKIAPRNPSTVRLKQDDHGNYDGFVQRVLAGTAAFVPGAAFTVSSTNDQVIKKDDSVLFVRNPEENPLYGRSDFLPAYYHYDKMHKLYYIAHLAYQLEAIPMRIGTYPKSADKDDVNRFFRNIAQLGFDSAMMKQEGFNVEEFGTKRASTDKMGLITHHKTEMYTAFLAQFMNTGTTSSAHSSLAAVKSFSGIFLMALQAIIQDIDDTFNLQVIPQMIDYNFGTRKYPKMIHRPLDTAKQEAIQNIFMKIMSSPADHATPEFMMAIEEELAEGLGLEVNYEEIRKQRLAQIIDLSIKKQQLEANPPKPGGAQATKQLIDSLYFSEPDEDGNITAHATNKTMDLIEQLVADSRSQLESELKAKGIDLSKAPVDDSKALKEPTYHITHVSLGEGLQKPPQTPEETNKWAKDVIEAVNKNSDSVQKLAEAEGKRTIVLEMPEQKAQELHIDKEAIKVDITHQDTPAPEAPKEEDSTEIIFIERNEDNSIKQIKRQKVKNGAAA